LLHPKIDATQFCITLVTVAFFRSSCHLAASLCAMTARCSTTFAVVHVMRVALFRTPVADVRAQFADLLCERTVSGNRIGAQAADRRALYAAGRAVIFALLANHVRETVAALGRTIVAGVDAVHCILVQMMSHGASPFIDD
jgi:hypothetical protein